MPAAESGHRAPASAAPAARRPAASASHAFAFRCAAFALATAVLACGSSPDGGTGDADGADAAAEAADVPHEIAADVPGGEDAGADESGGGDVAEALEDEPDDETEDAGDPCPPLMALVDDAFCIDIYEGRLEEQDAAGTWSAAEPYFTVGARIVRAVPAEGAVPQGYISGGEAQAACGRSGKRLCTSDEWLVACQGPAGHVYPYGDEHIDGACNDRYAGGHPVVDYFGTSEGVWDMAHMNDPGINRQPGTVAPGGSFADCSSDWGVLDMHGNLHEWVADADGTFRGGFYADAVLNGPGCLYRTTAHDSTYHDYSTGFRCCADR
ncbi:MAG: SUMF1/EgtB/PvdO family nonheme iron enzyme [Deltaproteobacteria bacterium]|nr:SUMF1/EgtB/PvdO family nonheme iron enzyme [Deltaproteobacteria bacterium]